LEGKTLAEKPSTRVQFASHAEVIRRALQLYEALIAEANKGSEISIRSEADGEVRYKPIF